MIISDIHMEIWEELLGSLILLQFNETGTIFSSQRFMPWRSWDTLSCTKSPLEF